MTPNFFKFHGNLKQTHLPLNEKKPERRTGFFSEKGVLLMKGGTPTAETDKKKNLVLLFTTDYRRLSFCVNSFV